MMRITTARSVNVLTNLANFHAEQALAAIKTLEGVEIPLTAEQQAVLVETALLLKAAMDTAQIIYERQAATEAA